MDGELAATHGCLLAAAKFYALKICPERHLKHQPQARDSAASVGAGMTATTIAKQPRATKTFLQKDAVSARLMPRSRSCALLQNQSQPNHLRPTHFLAMRRKDSSASAS